MVFTGVMVMLWFSLALGQIYRKNKLQVDQPNILKLVDAKENSQNLLADICGTGGVSSIVRDVFLDMRMAYRRKTSMPAFPRVRRRWPKLNWSRSSERENYR